MNMPALASSPRMVGRRAELETLLEAFEEGRGGSPRTVIVRGEAGIGKTRLIQEFLAEAALRADESPVLAVAQCVDLGPIGAPFGPVRRVLRDLHAAVGAEALRSAAGSPALIAALAALVPGIADTTPAGDEHVGEFAEAIEVLLETLSADRHIVIVIEDLQWADAATLGLLKTLAGTLRGRHLTITASYRSDDIDRFHPLHPVLAELERTRSIVRVELGRLSVGEVAEQVRLLRGDRFVEREADVLAVRSGGIPFLVEELVDLGDESLPETLRDLVLARYTRLGETAQEVVRAMAAGGLHTDHDVLRAVTSCDDRTLDLALREAIDARAVIAEGAGYTFRHALTQEAVHAEMLPSERVRVHRRYAEYLGSRDSASHDDVSAIAEHWLAARDQTAAFEATVAALAQSRATYSPATSAKLAERLTELWDQVPDAAARAGTTLAELHLDAAEAWHDLGEAERALRSANEGLDACRDDPLTRAALLRQRFVELFNTEHDERRDDLLAAAELLDGLDDRRAKALLSRVLSNVALTDLGSDARPSVERAIALAEEVGDDAALAVALTIEAWRIAEQEEDEPGALVPLERAVTLRLDPALRAYAGAAQLDMLGRLGRYTEAVVVGEQHYADVVRAGIERGSGSKIALCLADALLAAGQPAAAVRHAHRVRQLLVGRRGAAWLMVLARHYTWDDLAGARDELVHVERAAIDSAREHPLKHTAWAVEQAEAALTSGSDDAEDGGRARDAAMRALLPILEDASASASVRRSAAIAGAMLIAAGTHGPDADALREKIETAMPQWSPHGVNPIAADFVRAVLADADRDPADERISRWRSLAESLADGVLPVWLRHYARMRLAAAMIEAGDRAEAGALLEHIAAEAPVDGAARVGRWATELAGRAGLGAAADAANAAVSSLTPRELQVLALVAEGLTNPQIGRRLFISPKTASVHVSAILAKIGAANRTEAAAYYTAHRAAAPE